MRVSTRRSPGAAVGASSFTYVGSNGLRLVTRDPVAAHPGTQLQEAGRMLLPRSSALPFAGILEMKSVGQLVEKSIRHLWPHIRCRGNILELETKTFINGEI